MSRDVARGRKQGIMSVLVDEAWIHVTRGSFILVLGGVTHDFENRSDTRAGVLNLSIPGSFERPMPGFGESRHFVRQMECYIVNFAAFSKAIT